MNTNLIKLTKTLVSSESTPDNVDRLNKVISQSVQLAGKPTYIKKFSSQGFPSIFLANEKSPRYRLILNAHLDVVPGKPNQFKPVIKGDKLYGRGVYDMKGAAAAMIHAFSDTADRISYPLALQLVTDEEIGGIHGTKHQVEKGVRADFIIAGEPTNFDIKYQAKGIIQPEIVFKGTAAHAAYPWNGDNAIVQVMKFIQELLNEFPNPAKQAWKTTVNVSSIKTSNASANVIPDDCTLLLDIRFIPEDEKNVIKTIKKLLPPSAKIISMEQEPCHNTDRSHPFIINLQKATKKITGQNASLIQAMGASDLRHFSAKGVPGVEFGPIGNGHHTDHEWVSIKSLNTYYEILKDFILSIDRKETSK